MKKPIKILHFEDEPVFAEMYKAKFKQVCFDYKNYPNPPEKKDDLNELVVKENPNIILMDIIMPRMDGITATKSIKNDPKTRKYPVFALSNLRGDEDIKKAFTAGVDDYYVSAEYTPKQLVEILIEYLKNPAHYKRRGVFPDFSEIQ